MRHDNYLLEHIYDTQRSAIEKEFFKDLKMTILCLTILGASLLVASVI